MCMDHLDHLDRAGSYGHLHLGSIRRAKGRASLLRGTKQPKRIILAADPYRQPLSRVMRRVEVQGSAPTPGPEEAQGEEMQFLTST